MPALYMAYGTNKTTGDLRGSYRMHFNCTNSPASQVPSEIVLWEPSGQT